MNYMLCFLLELACSAGLWGFRTRGTTLQKMVPKELRHYAKIRVSGRSQT